MPDKQLIPIDNDQILLRGSCLRNTEWVIGICIYTGHETKIMKNGANAVNKTSKIMIQTNSYIKLTMLIQMSLSITAAVFNYFMTASRADELWYLYPNADTRDESTFDIIMDIVIQTGIWFIALMNFVPISMLVTLEMINFIQAFFITVDLKVTDEKTGLSAGVQSSNLNEELGMVHYIFSDKTGTLT